MTMYSHVIPVKYGQGTIHPLLIDPQDSGFMTWMSLVVSSFSAPTEGYDIDIAFRNPCSI
jgi:hypothetical protein